LTPAFWTSVTTLVDQGPDASSDRGEVLLRPVEEVEARFDVVTAQLPRPLLPRAERWAVGGDVEEGRLRAASAESQRVATGRRRAIGQ
jgi:hypothetical protein